MITQDIYDMVNGLKWEEKSQACVAKIFDLLTRLFGIDAFRELFQMILTDNGTKFQDLVNYLPKKGSFVQILSASPTGQAFSAEKSPPADPRSAT